ncbi:transposase [Opitutaceae bacterium TAV4]|nr:transposase [Opitutaceae bacterium TAV4]RRJ98452.1 transposase [Opitutaceae bacterium TAV3]
MARKLRIEYPGAVYHVINRGNYRADIFATEGARGAFAKTLDEACRRAGWVVHAWCLMSNHYHLALRTPEPNLISGMQWLQTTFSARFNRFRSERGHVFQGRYKALNIEPGKALGAVCHYIHLNPIRAHVMAMDDLAEWRGCSLRWVLKPTERAAWFDPSPAFQQPADLTDSPAGREAYKRYLDWLATDDDEQQKQCFEGLCSGWAFGSREFKKELLDEAEDPSALGIEDAAEARVMMWEKTLVELKARLGTPEIRATEKSADWKVAVAAEMKRRTTATNQWISDALGMGSMFTVSRLAKECREGKRAAKHLKRLAAKTPKNKA